MTPMFKNGLKRLPYEPRLIVTNGSLGRILWWLLELVKGEYSSHENRQICEYSFCDLAFVDILVATLPHSKFYPLQMDDSHHHMPPVRPFNLGRVFAIHLTCYADGWLLLLNESSPAPFIFWHKSLRNWSYRYRDTHLHSVNDRACALYLQRGCVFFDKRFV